MSNKLSILILPGLLTMCFLSFNHCASNGNLSVNDIPVDTIGFGRSGGFANLTERYAIGDNGTVYKDTGEELQKINRIKRSRLKAIQAGLDSLHIETMDLDEVGNMTYFLEVISDSVTYRVTWTESSEHPAIKDFYKTLVSTLPNQKK